MRYSYKRPKKFSGPKIHYRINEQITSLKVKLLDENGGYLGVLATNDAIRTAREKDLILVEISPKEDPPVAKIMDYGKFRYEKEKAMQKQRAKQKKVEIKGIKLSLRIGKHDLEFRRNQAIEFIEDGNKVNIGLMLKGRERQHAELAHEIIKNFINLIQEKKEIKIEQPITKQGSQLNAIITPK